MVKLVVMQPGLGLMMDVVRLVQDEEERNNLRRAATTTATVRPFRFNLHIPIPPSSAGLIYIFTRNNMVESMADYPIDEVFRRGCLMPRRGESFSYLD